MTKKLYTKEELMRKYPKQYLYTYPRWEDGIKMYELRKVYKTIHENSCLAAELD